MVGADWPSRARQTALRLSAAAVKDGNSNGIILLADIRDLFEQVKTDRLSSETIQKSLFNMEHRLWPEYDQGAPISPRQIAMLLEPFGIRPGTIRVDDKTPKGYKRSDFEDVFTRYLPPISSATAPQNQTGHLIDGPSGSEDWAARLDVMSDGLSV